MSHQIVITSFVAETPALSLSIPVCKLSRPCPIIEAAGIALNLYSPRADGR